jgi:hypothetical protein
MSRPALSVFVYGIYALGAGAGFLFFPDPILRLFGFPPRTDHWILVVAILTLGLAYYYLSSARAEDRHFFGMSWKGRIWFALATTTLAILGLAPWNILLVGSVDFITAIWTALALRSEQ